MSSKFGVDDALPCDHCPNAGPMAARMATIDGRLDRIEEAMFGTDKRAGIQEHVETLVTITKIGRSTARVLMWFGAGIVAIATGVFQFKQAIWGVFH
jgi:hypothetical protein